MLDKVKEIGLLNSNSQLKLPPYHYVFIALIWTYRYCEIFIIVLMLQVIVKDMFLCLLGFLLPMRPNFFENKYVHMPLPISIILWLSNQGCSAFHLKVSFGELGT